EHRHHQPPDDPRAPDAAHEGEGLSHRHRGPEPEPLHNPEEPVVDPLQHRAGRRRPHHEDDGEHADQEVPGHPQRPADVGDHDATAIGSTATPSTASSTIAARRDSPVASHRYSGAPMTSPKAAPPTMSRGLWAPTYT